MEFKIIVNQSPVDNNTIKLDSYEVAGGGMNYKTDNTKDLITFLYHELAKINDVFYSEGLPEGFCPVCGKKCTRC